MSTGAIGISDMTAIAALAKTMVLLAEQGWGGNNWEAGTAHSLIVQSRAGECAVTDRIGVLGRNRLLPGESLTTLDGSATLTNDRARGLTICGPDGKTRWEAPAQMPPNQPADLITDGGSVGLTGQPFGTPPPDCPLLAWRYAVPWPTARSNLWQPRWKAVVSTPCLASQRRR